MQDSRVAIRPKIDEVNECLVSIFERELQQYQLKDLVESMKYTLMGDGKRMRPLLTIAVYEMFNANYHDVIAPACTVELIHTSSLMLDDLPCMDNAVFRRGRKANHTQFSESTTILASAALFSTSFKLLSEIPDIHINELIGDTASAIGGGGLIKGQFMDLASFSEVRTTAELDEMYYLKTGVLFELSAKIGSMVAKADKKTMTEITSIGRDIGCAYQIRDDIIDSLQSTRQSGKDMNLDVRNQKPTYVSILGIEKAQKVYEDILGGIMRRSQKLHNPASLVEFIENLYLKD